jgi:hypothetical protein
MPEGLLSQSACQYLERPAVALTVCLKFLVGLAGLSWPELPASYTLLQHHAQKFLDFQGEDGKIMKSPQACPPCPIHAFYQHRSW